MHKVHIAAPFASAVALLAGANVHAETIHVPADAPTIAAAVALALDGDVVELAPGTYTGDGNRDVVIDGPMITVRGAAGSSETVIDCQGSQRAPHRAFAVTSVAFALEGITIRNGVVNGDGGGMWVSPVDAYGDYAMTDCVIESCTARTDAEQRSGGNGGGVALWSAASFIVKRCQFKNNVAEFGGAAGLQCYDVWTLSLTESAFDSNQGGVAGTGGLSAWVYGETFIDRCEFAHNSGVAGGIGLHSEWSLFMENCLVHDNVADVYPGAYLFSQHTEVSYSTFVNNTSSDPNTFTASVSLWYGYTRGSIFWDEYLDLGSCLPLSCCIKNSSWAGSFGNTSADPLFVDPANENYHLQSTSPLIDYGGIVPLFGGLLDLDGNQREVDILAVPNGVATAKDLGCYEVQLPAPSADLDANGVVNGSDLAILLGAWGAPCNGCVADLDLDGVVGAADLAILLGSWD